MSETHTIAIDFDGVINGYQSGWTGPADLPDDPVPGAAEALREYVKQFKVVVMSTRAETPEGKQGIWDYLHKHFPDIAGQISDVTHLKIKAGWYIDDKARPVAADAFPTVESLKQKADTHKNSESLMPAYAQACVGIDEAMASGETQNIETEHCSIVVIPKDSTRVG